MLLCIGFPRTPDKVQQLTVYSQSSQLQGIVGTYIKSNYTVGCPNHVKSEKAHGMVVPLSANMLLRKCWIILYEAMIQTLQNAPQQMKYIHLMGMAELVWDASGRMDFYSFLVQFRTQTFFKWTGNACKIRGLEAHRNTVTSTLHMVRQSGIESIHIHSCTYRSLGCVCQSLILWYFLQGPSSHIQPWPPIYPHTNSVG